jgi:hypothetical protein
MQNSNHFARAGAAVEPPPSRREADMVEIPVLPGGNGRPPDVPAEAAPVAAGPGKPPVEEQPMTSRQRALIGTLLVLATVVLMLHLIAIWPAVIDATLATPTTAETPLLLGIVHTTFSPDVVLITMVLVVGALGAFVGATRRFLTYATRDELTKRDEWSYLMRPLQGAVLALIVYFTLRGGYLGQDGKAPLNPYGVATLAGLVGLFTRHAVEKLTAIFDTMFGRPQEDADPVPVTKESRAEQLA